ncbi:WD domain, G-beta repeat, partial [Musa troglodytarum]
ATSISWSPDGKVLAVTFGNSDLDLVDAAIGRVLVGIQGDSHSFVCSLAWRSNRILTTERSDGSVVDCDIRKDDRAICDYKGYRLKFVVLNGLSCLGGI